MIEKNIRMIYKILDVHPLPKDVKQIMMESGAVFFDVFSKSKPNKFEVKIMDTN